MSRLIKYPLWDGARIQNEGAEIENLAEFVVDYARMKQAWNPGEIAFVEVDELAFRFREDETVIRGVLHFLEHHQRAKKTKLEGLWKLQI